MYDNGRETTKSTKDTKNRRNSWWGARGSEDVCELADPTAVSDAEPGRS